MKKLELTEADFVYVKAINVLLNNGQLQLHGVEKEDLNHIGSTFNWVAQLQIRMAKAPEELNQAEVMQNAEKVNTDPKKKSSPKKAGGTK
jgi:hypothetical protein